MLIIGLVSVKGLYNLTNLNLEGFVFDDKPFRHWVCDNFLDTELAFKLYTFFPHTKQDWYKYENVFEKKRATDRLTQMPDLHVSLLTLLNSHVFIEYLEKMTGIEGIIPDPWFRGGGLHQIHTGGKLDVHADFNWHTHLKLDRRLNALLYLNYGWQEEWGGHLELWRTDMTECVKKISPAFNRMVIFETTDSSYHGHPEPLQCPDHVTRKSMAWYFYTNGRPESEKSKQHSTLFKRRPTDPVSEEVEALRKKRGKGRV